MEVAMHDQHENPEAERGSGMGTPPNDPGWRPAQRAPEIPPRPFPNAWELRSQRKMPLIAGLLSFFPGLGQIYVGYYLRGFIHCIIVATLIGILSTAGGDAPKPMFGFFMAFFWLYNVIDAARLASLYNEALTGTDPAKRPVPALPRQGGAAAGVLLIIAGIIFFTNTLGGVSLEWIEDWWPALPLGLGVYLVLATVRDKSRKETPL
jgi:hypothetical protein